MAADVKGKWSQDISFDDFLVTKVIDGQEGVSNGNFGKHWAPYYKVCSTCSVGYDYISYLDPTMEETKVKILAFHNPQFMIRSSFLHSI